ncbi:MAG: hypothetical protein LCH32_13970 [Bacteroidetes bacterium]|nr:hypothetical protein [Bacteroidota bacterium]
MKAFAFFISCIIVYSANSKTILTFKKAIEANIVNAKSINVGGYQGKCMQLTVTNLTNDSIEVQLEPGLIFDSKIDERQDILVIQEEFFVLGGKSSLTKKIKGYCCQASKSAPNSGDSYTFNFKSDYALNKLAQFLNNRNYNANAEQQAIWAISDKKNTANITGGNDSLQVELRHFVAGLKGEPIPWYILETKTINYASGNMETIPLNLKGEIDFSLPQESYTTMHVLNNKGEEVSKIIKQYLRAGANQKMPLKLPIYGLAKGKYLIELRTEKNIVCQKEFEIT